MIVIVVRALTDSGALNAGTPFETASTPVIALQPSANARISRRRLERLERDLGERTPVTCGGAPRIVRTTPTPISASVATTKMYVGIAKTVPLSRTPRRLMTATRTIATAPSRRAGPGAPGRRRRAPTMPAATLTETVRT